MHLNLEGKTNLMRKVSPLINNFNAGELSPELDLRVDIDKYYSGCRTLQNMVPLVEGGAMRMPGTYYTATVKNLAIPISEGTDVFYITDMTTDGTFLYVCGGDCVTKAQIKKMSMGPIPYVISTYNYTALNPLFYGIDYYDGYLYVCGYDYNAGTNQQWAIAQKVSVDMTTMVWAHSFDRPSYNQDYYEGIVVENPFVYITGTNGNNGIAYNTIKTKLNISDGSQVWNFYNTSYGGVGILAPSGSNYIYILKSEAIEKVLKTDGSNSQTAYASDMHQKGDCDVSYLYVAGEDPVLGDYNGLVRKIKFSDMSTIWSYHRKTKSPGWDSNNACKTDGNHIYILGETDVPRYLILEKIDMDGNLMWTQNLTSDNHRAWFAIILSGDYVFIGGYNITTYIGFVERRLKSTGLKG